MNRIEFESHWRRSELRVRAFLAAACSDGAMVSDLAQETALAAWRKRDQFDPTRDFMAWVIGMARFDLDPGKAKGYVVEPVPGEHESSRVVYRVDGKSWWALEKGTLLPAERYTVSAVLTVDQKLSGWKGEIATGMLEIEIPKK